MNWVKICATLGAGILGAWTSPKHHLQKSNNSDPLYYYNYNITFGEITSLAFDGLITTTTAEAMSGCNNTASQVCMFGYIYRQYPLPQSPPPSWVDVIYTGI